MSLDALLTLEDGATERALRALVLVDVLRLDVDACQRARLELLAADATLGSLRRVMTFLVRAPTSIRLKPVQSHNIY